MTFSFYPVSNDKGGSLATLIVLGGGTFCKHNGVSAVRILASRFWLGLLDPSSGQCAVYATLDPSASGTRQPWREGSRDFGDIRFRDIGNLGNV